MPAYELPLFVACPTAVPSITFNIKGTAPATFSHTIHTAAFGCKECHTRIFPSKSVVGKATMEDMGKGKSCGSCHNAPMKIVSRGGYPIYPQARAGLFRAY